MFLVDEGSDEIGVDPVADRAAADYCELIVSDGPSLLRRSHV